MDAVSLILFVTGIIFLAAFVRSSLGFGDAVLAMPLLTLVIDLKTAAPLVAMLAPLISILILAGHWKKGDMKTAFRIAAASLLGIPVGIYGLARLPEAPLKLVLGTVILLYGLFGLLKPSVRIKDERPGLTLIIGFGSGILGGAFNTNGPPVVAYGMLKGWGPEKFRATLQGFFLPVGLFILAGHGVAGLWTREVLRLWIYSLPGLFLGFTAGGWINKRIARGQFNRIVYIVLTIMGGMVIARAL